ncbi:MAG TPA: hypothetical protein VHD15_10220 [Hyphomicrobiales bacterium]|nr:hypothetical protein [Hyphomicrobiales bacterium]
MDEEGEPFAAATFSRASAKIDPAVPHPLSSRSAPSGLALVADLAPPGVLAEALKSVREVGVDLIDALMASADVDADTVVHRLARRMGIAALVAGDPLPSSPALAAHEAAAALRSGLLHLADGRTVVAARGTALRGLVRGLRTPVGRDRILLATPRRFAELVLDGSGVTLVSTCRDLLERQAPHLSARPLVVTRSAAVALAALVGLAIAVLSYAPPLGHVAVSLFFLLLAAIRLAAATRTILPPSSPPALPPISAELPIYSVVVPLYRESRALAGLLDALAALDYPALGSKRTTIA